MGESKDVSRGSSGTEAHRVLARIAVHSHDAQAAERHWTAVAAWIPEDAEAIRNLQELAGRK